MPRLALILIALVLFPAPAAAERVLIQTEEGEWGSTHIVIRAMFSPDGETILTGGSDGTARLWDTATGREIRRLEGHEGRVYESRVESVAFSPDGEMILTDGTDGATRLWDTETGREIRRFEGHEDWVLSATFSPDGETALTGSKDETAKLWDVPTGREIRRFKGHDGAVTSAAFSPDGETILTGGTDGTARLWDAATGRETRRFDGHEESVWSIAVSADGETVLTGSQDKTARLWDTETGREIRRCVEQGSLGWVSGIFDPSGKGVLIYASDDSSGDMSSTVTLHDLPREVWPAPPAPLVATRPDALGLIIGNRDYDAAPAVDYALDDAAAYKATFEEALGLDPENIFVLENASSVEMQRWFGAPAAPEGRLHRLARHYDEVFIAYSGHGVPKVRAEGPAEGYLLPVDVPPGEPAFGGYPIGRLITQLESVPVKRITVFLDACFSGLTPAGELVPDVSGAFGVAVAPPKQEAKVSVLAATAFDRPQYAHWSPETENGVFTRHIVAGLRGAADDNGDDALSLSELHGYVGRQVVRETLRRADREQTPSLRSDDSDQILTTFGGG